MRNFFLALVLANLGFAAWHFWFAETDAPVSRTASAASTITLVEELDEADVVEVIEERCISIGTFAERSQADAAAASLRVMGFEAEVADVDAASTESADADLASVEPGDPVDPADAASAESEAPADPDARFRIDVVIRGLETPAAGQLQPLDLDLLAPPDEDASQSPAIVMSLTLRACDSATD